MRPQWIFERDTKSDKIYGKMTNSGKKDSLTALKIRLDHQHLNFGKYREIAGTKKKKKEFWSH